MRSFGFACLGLIILAVVAAPTCAEVNMEDAVGLWLFDEGQGQTVKDISGNENHGTFNGAPEWAEGVFGAAVNCATRGHVLIKDSDSLDLDKAWTVAIWVNINPPMDRWQTVLNKRFDIATNYVIRLSQDRVKWEVMINNGGWVRLSDPNPPQGGEWVHLAGTYDGGSTLTFFVNGEQVATRSGVAPPPVNTIDLRLGSYAGNSGGIDGMMDETAVFKAALEPEDIRFIMEEGLEVALGIDGAGLAKAGSPIPKDGAIHENTWVTLSWRAGASAVSHDVYVGESFDDVNNGAADTFRGNQTSTLFFVGLGMPGDPYPGGLVVGTTYYWCVDEVNNADPNSPWKGNVWSFSLPPRTAYNPNPADGAEFVDLNAILSWTGGYGSKVHTVYLGESFEEVDGAAGGASIGTASYDPGTLEREKVLYWRVDEFDGVETHKGQVWSFTTPGAVGKPQPTNGAVDVPITAMLSWTAADNASSHEVYFGTDADAVGNATKASPEYAGARLLGSETYNPGKLGWATAYHWRVDEVYPGSTVKGLVWSFVTVAFIWVDDFESYNDIDPPDPNSNRIFESWVDGFGTTTNGALVGHDLPPYAERTIVHGGGQSMIYRYDNNLKTSEATLTLTAGRDWTEEGVKKLSLWLRGASGNAAERMFISLNGNGVVYHSDPAVTQKTGWNEWVIDLTAFAGVDLTNVNTITIGFGTKNSPAAGGTGTVYFDDIRLYR